MLPPVILCSATLLTDPMQPGGDALALQVEATAAAGFDGLSLWTLHHAAAVGAGASPEAVREQVRDAGLSVPMVEAMALVTIADHWLRQRTVDVLDR